MHLGLGAGKQVTSGRCLAVIAADELAYREVNAVF